MSIRTIHCAGAVTLTHKGKLVLVSKDKELWQFPKGRVENKESVVDAAIREVQEEAGIRELVVGRPSFGKYMLEGKDSQTRRLVSMILTHTEKTPRKLKPQDPQYVASQPFSLPVDTDLFRYKEEAKFYEEKEEQIREYAMQLRQAIDEIHLL